MYLNCIQHELKFFFYLFKDFSAKEVWKTQFHKPTQVIAIGSRDAVEHVHSQGRVLSDRSVLYKYINPNMVAILTLAPDTTHKSIFYS